jgi:hypothetical protein
MSPFLADCVAKVFWAIHRERLIQAAPLKRNIDSRALIPRFVCFKLQFHNRFLATFATKSAQNGHRGMSALTSAHSGKADVADL